MIKERAQLVTRQLFLVRSIEYRSDGPLADVARNLVGSRCIERRQRLVLDEALPVENAVDDAAQFKRLGGLKIMLRDRDDARAGPLHVASIFGRVQPRKIDVDVVGDSLVRTVVGAAAAYAALQFRS